MTEESPLGLTPQLWEIVRSILTGERTTELMGVPTLRDAAEAAGVTVAMLHRWKVRSEQKRKDDEPWIHEIAQVFKDLAVLQEVAVEEVLLHRGIHGVEERITRDVLVKGAGGESVIESVIESVRTIKIKPDTNVLIRFLELRQKSSGKKPGDRTQEESLNDWMRDMLSDPAKAERALTFMERMVIEQKKGTLH